MQASDYQFALLSLLPSGDAWALDTDSELSELMLGLAQELARIDARSRALLAESLPSQTVDLLTAWEKQYGLPDACVVGEQAMDERKAALQQKYRVYGSQSREFLIELAAALGIPASITEYRHIRFGDTFGQPWYGTDWNFVIQVDAEIIPEQTALMARLECVIRKLAHAHKVTIFNY